MNKRFPTSIGIALIFILVVTISVFVWKCRERLDSPLLENSSTRTNPEKDTSSENVPNLQASDRQFPDMSQDEKNRLTELTKDWLTYRNEAYGYEFKYPKEYVIEKVEYSKDMDQVRVVSKGKCVLVLEGGSTGPCAVNIRTASMTDERVGEQKENKDLSIVRFSVNGNRITYQPSDRFTAVIQAKEKMCSMSATPYNREIIPVFQGIYFTFREIN